MEISQPFSLDPSDFVASITGTANQVLVNGTSGTPQTGAVTLSLPQDIATSSVVQFASLGLGGAFGSELAPAINSSNWTGGGTGGWASISGGVLDKNGNGTGTMQPTSALSITVGTLYRVEITFSAFSVGGINTVTLGGATLANISGNYSTGTYVDYVIAQTTANLIITPTTSASRFTISSVSVKAMPPFSIDGSTSVASGQEGYFTQGSAGTALIGYTPLSTGGSPFRVLFPGGAIISTFTNSGNPNTQIYFGSNGNGTMSFIRGSSNYNNGTVAWQLNGNQLALYPGSNGGSDLGLSGTRVGTVYTQNLNASTGMISPKWYPSADSTTALQILKANGSTSVVTVDTTNALVGINGTPTVTLDVYSTARGWLRISTNSATDDASISFANSSNIGAFLTLGSSSKAGTLLGISRANNAFLLTDSGIGFYLGTRGSQNLALATNDTIRMTIDSSGSVGVNTTTMSYRFNVDGVVNSFGSAAGVFARGTAGIGAGNRWASYGTTADEYVGVYSSGASLRVSIGGFSVTTQATSSGVQSNSVFTGSADTNQTASTEKIDINFNLARTVQWATGALTTQRAMLLQAPTYSFVGASTITNAATFAITGSPVAGTNATITNAYALWIQGGMSQFDGVLRMGNILRLKGYTVATLPTGVQGDRAYVTDALTPTYGAVATGGGAVVVPVFYDGTNWVTA